MHTLDASLVSSTAIVSYSCPVIEFELYCDLEADGNYVECFGTGDPAILTDAGEWFMIDGNDFKIINQIALFDEYISTN